MNRSFPNLVTFRFPFPVQADFRANGIPGASSRNGMPTAAWWHPSGRMDCWPRWWSGPTTPAPAISR
jgi:hypothetical protein